MSSHQSCIEGNIKWLLNTTVTFPQLQINGERITTINRMLDQWRENEICK